MTTRQKIYIVFMHSIGAGILDAVINSAIAYAMYAHSASYLWDFPNTLAGDAAVTVIIQNTLTWVIDGALTHNDVRKGTVKPLPGLNGPDAPTWWGSRFPAFWTRSSLDLFVPGLAIADRLKAVANAFVRGLLFALLCLPLAWVVGVGITAAIWPAFRENEAVIGWRPIVFKAIYSGLVGALTTPISTIVALGQAHPNTFDDLEEAVPKYGGEPMPLPDLDFPALPPVAAGAIGRTKV
ncbi:hypothetical protein HKX48_003051 [Thoreauomyces humboldtii]|nr:hypothetical protein HKX48_003051 [Thoreauomyces humboldtii]